MIHQQLLDQQFMQMALDLAKQGLGRTSPNPMVGAVVAQDGKAVGQGWHQRAGTPHAEVHALQAAGDQANGATLYVTLEPCCHHGKTPPCTDAVIKAGIRRVVVAMTDPNPCVGGGGIARLKAAGVEVVSGILAQEAARLNEVFIKWISTGLPFAILKTAMTLDGKIATVSGRSKWITGDAARQRVHMLRDRCDAILAGIGTVLADDPSLTTRLPQGGKNPIRIILDSQARIPLDANVITDVLAPTIIVVGPHAPAEKLTALRSKGVEILAVRCRDGGLDLRELFQTLGSRNITSVLVEGGAAVNAGLIRENLIDKVYWFIAPKFFGGISAPGPVGGEGIAAVDQAVALEDIAVEAIDQDLMITGYVERREGRHVYRACGGTGQSEIPEPGGKII
ncbi:bifunctional diaminohydroxyphosphoribosylaminopyrimidine deaminase/5-amino-6-(5-phosphoribosylamino)uracil reductase RibD [Acetonema longum]|uniref:Riboflavin biosynthesis protein RibD n=1 Tax=Acetonema longum DSM 6540 TaxID=1009370 RepID=F7NLF6_9FIRM|nr:bifunctional diaminohydroxyphosphoribosylaminopyrimidine deaminase/5-amino-6-(5-phosphoribosylamino)uracil reductase RibD [Acetonema longum]EGO63261.1 riboflavin biosynthesis protein RibD [Acetonema longum DSM 6540]